MDLATAAPSDWAARWLRATARPRLLVVGGASLDVIHVHGEPVRTPGGAGLYTALAAARAGVEVTMLAPLPNPMPPELAPALEHLTWIGPEVSIDGLPRFEIAYDEQGAITLFREHLGAEPDMTPSLLDLVDDLPATAYCVPFMDARLQRQFIDALAAHGCLTVASTYGKAVRIETDLVRDTMAIADLSFCNSDEEQVLYCSDAPLDAAPTSGRLRFVTRGARGASVYQGDHRTDVAGTRTEPLDPTGAGDTFCGTTVARILLGDHPVEAARRASAAAAEMVTMVGPAALWQPGPPPAPEIDARVVVDTERVDRMGALVRDLADLQAFDFVSELFPAVGDPSALAWLAAATLQQYGFWYERDHHYVGPMIARIDGVDRKGSDYLWAAYMRWARFDADAMTPSVQATLSASVWNDIAADDAGHDPFPAPATCVEMANAYGRTLLEIDTTIERLVAAAAATATPMRSLLTLLDHVGGYREDSLRKKAALLGVILRQRPERYIPDAPASTSGDGTDDAPPIVDYHVQRSNLRTGMVHVADPALRARLVNREVLTSDDEAAVRRATFAAVQRLAEVSGRTMGTVDWFLFQMRHRCPEMSTPACDQCPANPVCTHHVELFQPVLRTTAY